MDIQDHLAPAHAPASVAHNRRELTVRAEIYGMRVAAVWQVVMSIARDIENIRIATDQRHGYEQVTLSFARASFESLEAIADRLRQMPWVANTTLC
ncbi:hypothetical protein [Paraburkholderia aromaticivorans]|uniref:hypothetical protein n=1 Tax=Paraburkholderia aromaticivorans TaxID=2026199 RepID=UPI0014561157|nr:hypothetical protein [Paraburkholderia aromaticivorans]